MFGIPFVFFFVLVFFPLIYNTLLYLIVLFLGTTTQTSNLVSNNLGGINDPSLQNISNSVLETSQLSQGLLFGFLNKFKTLIVHYFPILTLFGIVVLTIILILDKEFSFLRKVKERLKGES